MALLSSALAGLDAVVPGLVWELQDRSVIRLILSLGEIFLVVKLVHGRGISCVASFRVC